MQSPIQSVPTAVIILQQIPLNVIPSSMSISRPHSLSVSLFSVAAPFTIHMSLRTFIICKMKVIVIFYSILLHRTVLELYMNVHINASM